MPVHGISHNPPSTQAGAFSTYLLWSTCIPGICRRIMLLKGVALRRDWEREGARRGEKTWRKGWLRGVAENVQARGRGSICFLEQRGVAPFSAVAKKSSRTSRISFFPPPLDSHVPHTRNAYRMIQNRRISESIALFNKSQDDWSFFRTESFERRVTMLAIKIKILFWWINYFDEHDFNYSNKFLFPVLISVM